MARRWPDGLVPPQPPTCMPANCTVMAGQSIDLGQFHGVVHPFTSEGDVYRVVATIADGEAGSPLRFSTTLAEHQSATILTTGQAGRSWL